MRCGGRQNRSAEDGQCGPTGDLGSSTHSIALEDGAFVEGLLRTKDAFVIGVRCMEDPGAGVPPGVGFGTTVVGALLTYGTAVEEVDRRSVPDSTNGEANG